MSEIKEKNEPLNKNNKVPKLRFPYFFTEWTKSSFGDAVSLSKEKYNPSKCNDKKIDIEMDSIESNTGRLLIKYSSSDYNSIKNIFSSNSILYGKLRPYLRKFYKATFEGVCSSEFWVFNPSQTTQDFLYYFISTDYFNINANKTCGTKMPRAEWDKVKELHFYYPSKEEQIKIANFLEYIDKKIILTNNKLDILKKYKKGLAKEAIKDTILYWKNGIGNATALSNYLTEINEYSEKDGTYPHVTLSTEGISEKSDRYDRDFLVKDDNKKYKVTHINQLCYNPANLKFGVICINRYGDGIFSPIYVTFKVKNIDLEYLELIVTSIDFNRYSMKYQQGTVYERMSVSPEDLCKIKIVITDENKQKNISLTANILNKKISKLESELNNLMLIKSNLLNNMFI